MLIAQAHSSRRALTPFCFKKEKTQSQPVLKHLNKSVIRKKARVSFIPLCSLRTWILCSRKQTLIASATQTLQQDLGPCRETQPKHQKKQRSTVHKTLLTLSLGQGSLESCLEALLQHCEHCHFPQPLQSKGTPQLPEHTWKSFNYLDPSHSKPLQSRRNAGLMQTPLATCAGKTGKYTDPCSWEVRLPVKSI